MGQKNKRAEASLTISKLISLIIVVLVLVLVVLGVIYLYNKDFFNNLPGFSSGNNSNENYDSTLCPFNTAEIKEDYIYITGAENNYLEFRENKIYANSNFLSSDPYIGEIKGERVELIKGLVSGEPENYKPYVDYREYLPTIEQLKMFEGSYRLGESRFFCKSLAEKTAYEFGLNCKESCSLYNGICRTSAPSVSISLGKLDCNEGSLCYISISEEKTYENEFRIETFRFDALSTHGQRPVLENNFELAEFSSGEARPFSYEITDEIPFCYIIRTDKKIIDSGYFWNSINDKNKGSILFQYTNDKFFEFIAWNPESGQKIYQKVKLGLKGNDENFAGGKFVDNNDFKKEALLLKDNEFFYTTLNNPINFDDRIPSSYSIYNYKIEKMDEDEIVIYGLYQAKLDPLDTFSESGNVGRWHKLDCSTGLFSTGTSIYINELKESLRDTIADQNCKIIDE